MGFLKKVKYFLVKKTTKLLIHAIIKTCRFEITGTEKIDRLREKGIPIIYAYWHRHIFATIYRFKNTMARPLISLSDDGELVAQVAVEFRMNPVRGSSSQGGARAFLELVNTIKKGSSEILITADGPKGPPRQLKDGTVRLAQKTDAAIVPLSWSSSKEKVFEKTWDKFKIPLPFSKIVYIYGEPFYVQGEKGKKNDMDLKKSIEESLNNLENEANRLSTR